MSQCVAVVELEGQPVLVPSPAVECTTFVLLTPVEYSALSHNPFVLDVEDGLLVSGAVGAVWLLAWAVRMVRAALSSPGDSET